MNLSLRNLQDLLDDFDYLLSLALICRVNSTSKDIQFISHKDETKFSVNDLARLSQVVEKISLWCDLGNCNIDPTPIWDFLRVSTRRLEILNEVHAQPDGSEYKGVLGNRSISFTMNPIELEVEDLQSRSDYEDLQMYCELNDRCINFSRRFGNVLNEQCSTKENVDFQEISDHKELDQIIRNNQSYLSPRASRIADLVLKTTDLKLDFSEAQERLVGKESYDETDINTWNKWRTEFNNAVAESGYKMTVSKKEQCFQIVKEFEPATK